MKLQELNLLLEASFSPKNFPKEGNEAFAGAGERTNHVAGTKNDTEGFPLDADTLVYNAQGKVVRTIPAGTKVFITRPGRLIRGRDIGIKSDVIMTGVSLRGPGPKHMIGVAAIKNIIKPGGGQSRLLKGKAAQDTIADALKKTHNVEKVESVKIGSTKTDLTLVVDGETINFEVKGRDTSSAPITFFDKSARRGAANEVLDNFSSIITDGRAGSFEEMVDQFKEQDPTIGFPGDEGVGKSGKLPTGLLSASDPAKMKKFKRYIKQHFAENGDNYFAVHNRDKNVIDVYFTGNGANTLDAPPLPDFDRVSLLTYGGPSGGAMRVGIKIKLRPTEGMQLTTDTQPKPTKKEKVPAKNSK